jgi:hypothetical protein
MTAAKKETIAVTPRIEAEAKALWESGDFKTKADVARHLRISIPACSKILKGIERGKVEREVREKVARTVASDVMADVNLRTARARESKEEHYKMAAGIAKLTWQEVVKAKTEGLPLSSIAHNLKALDIAMTILKKSREERFAVLGIVEGQPEADDELPQLVISELTPEEVEELRLAQDDEDSLGDAPLLTDESDEGIVDTTGDNEDEPDDS